MYDYECSECHETLELNVPYEEKDDERQHEPTPGGCKGELAQVWLTPPASGVGAYQMKAVMFNRNEQKVGHVPGHFGKLAKNKGKKA